MGFANNTTGKEKPTAKQLLAISSLPVKTIEEFCLVNRLSRAHYYELRNNGAGPREMRMGRHVAITAEAELDWRRAREGAAVVTGEAA